MFIKSVLGRDLCNKTLGSADQGMPLNVFKAGFQIERFFGNIVTSHCRLSRKSNVYHYCVHFQELYKTSVIINFFIGDY